MSGRSWPSALEVWDSQSVQTALPPATTSGSHTSSPEQSRPEAKWVWHKWVWLIYVYKVILQQPTTTSRNTHRECVCVLRSWPATSNNSLLILLMEGLDRVTCWTPFMHSTNHNNPYNTPEDMGMVCSILKILVHDHEGE